MTTTTTTIETVTEQQIRDLREEARRAGDERTVDLCNEVLHDACLPGCDLPRESTALATLVAVISDAEAQS